jgi:hypothetical protein
VTQWSLLVCHGELDWAVLVILLVEYLDLLVLSHIGGLFICLDLTGLHFLALLLDYRWLGLT